MENQFLACVPIKDIVWDSFNTNIQEQSKLYDKIFHSDIVLQGYAPPINYQLNFLKQWINKVEKDAGQEIIESVYTLYTKLISQVNSTSDEYCYKSYYLNDSYVTLKESRALISNGTTGLHTWEAALYLTEWIAENSQIFHNSNIIEIGSGIGLLGLCTLHLTDPLSYTFTDSNPHVLSLLKDNITINKSLIKTTVDIKQLNWDSHEEISETYKYILASDVVYDVQMINPLVSLLEKLLIKSTDTVGYIASVIRNSETYDYFIKALNESTICYKELLLADKRIFYVNRLLPVSIIQLNSL